MKFKSEKLFLSLVLLASAQVNQVHAAASFNGFYVGAVGGFVRNNLKGELGFDSLTLKSKTTHVNGFLFGLVSGYGLNLNGFYLGGEIGVQSDTANKNKNYRYNGVGNEGTIKAKYQRGIVLTGAPRLGVIFAESWLAYVKPALEISRDKTTASNEDGETESSKKKLKFVFVPTVGIEKVFSSKFLVRLEYAYNFGADAKFSSVEEGITGSHKVKYTSHAVKVGIGYRF